MIPFLTQLDSGHIGILTPMMPASHLRQQLGDPDETSLIRPLILKYGSLEVTVKNGVVDLIMIYAGRTVSLPAGLGIEAALEENLPMMTFRSTIADLDRARLAWRVSKDLTFDDQVAIELNSGASTMLFVKEGLEKVALRAIPS